MAGSDRAPPHLVKLLEEMERNPYAFDFYQAVRVLDCAQAGTPPTGRSARVGDDPIRFGQEVSLGFAPATLSRVEPANAERPRRFLQRFFGMFGPNGALPLHLTEYARDRVRDHGDHTFIRFVDLFHHRMISLFYRAWARVRPTVSFDSPHYDRFSDYVGALFGLGMSSLRNCDAFPDLPKRHFAGLLACQTKHADGLLAMLGGYFRFPLDTQEFVGHWVQLPPGCQCLLGQSSSELGVTTTVGSHIWDCQQKFRIIVGPLTLEEYYHMLPGGADGDPTTWESLDAMVAAVRTYIGDELDWDLQLILRREETPPILLGEQGLLGWTTWMPQEVRLEDPADLVLSPLERVLTGQSHGAYEVVTIEPTGAAAEFVGNLSV